MPFCDGTPPSLRRVVGDDRGGVRRDDGTTGEVSIGTKHAQRNGLGQSHRPHVPRLAQLLALASKLEGLVRDGIIGDYATLARLGHVTVPA